ncbi:3-phosphoshikimate 1-carboxyvinyltransferase [Streptomyces chumphonensis]|uniref:3-phosphoshikimate 1-carboxyvinyltransferase n=1 Tax=Streptomyces chumphonensis TaxID=1214925 RepID=A0A927F3P3_9ACTN|nr:3-phosphoshikimate 1-carboxyvinyltransferase [Streptomyces chumphonensis]MBD3934430.1 3-phosphoshikimate 1-carboxyvinyltransferase [Streptomyces chumphonensis]
MSATSDPRLQQDAVTVVPCGGISAEATPPGSKSYTNRYLAIAALSGRETLIEGALLSDDTRYFASAVAAFGHVRTTIDEERSSILVEPTGDAMRAPAEDVYMGGAGTPLRFLIAMAGHAEGTTTITGNARMQERPMGDLLSALPMLGVEAVAVRGNGSPPVRVTGGTFLGGRTRISGTVSSQFTSSLLINSVHAANDTRIEVVDELISQPYVDMTIAALAEMGVRIEREGYRSFTVPCGQQPRGGRVTVEPDASGMSYLLAAAAVTEGEVAIPGIGADSRQGDVGLAEVLERMGCRVQLNGDSVTLKGGPLRGVDIDMEAMPDVVPTLAVVAAFAEGDTRITNIASLRVKECDRIAAVTNELRRMGITVHESADAMHIVGGVPRGAGVETYDDHRIAMSFAVAGLRTEGVTIKDPGCVAKSFPGFWRVLDQLHPGKASTA